MQDLTHHIRRILRREKDKARRDLFRLAGTAESHIRTKRLDIFRRKCRWNERCPDRTRRDTIDANPLFGERLRKRMREGDDRALLVEE